MPPRSCSYHSRPTRRFDDSGSEARGIIWFPGWGWSWSPDGQALLIDVLTGGRDQTADGAVVGSFPTPSRGGYVVDVDGKRQVFLAQVNNPGSAQDRAELESVLDAIRIKRPNVGRNGRRPRIQGPGACH